MGRIEWGVVAHLSVRPLTLSVELAGIGRAGGGVPAVLRGRNLLKFFSITVVNGKVV